MPLFCVVSNPNDCKSFSLMIQLNDLSITRLHLCITIGIHSTGVITEGIVGLVDT